MRKFVPGICCIFFLSLMMPIGNVVASEQQTANFATIQKAAEQGNAEAQFRLGWAYFRGDSVPKDWDKARQWYEKAAAQEHAEAQFRLGLMYRLGQGVSQDLARAMIWFEKAAEKGHPVAQANLPSRDAPQKRMPPEKEKGATGKPCLDRNQISRTMSPADLYLNLHTCIREEKYDEALILFGAAGTFGRFDMLRVTDKTARGIVMFMKDVSIQAHPNEKAERFKEKALRFFNDKPRLAGLCAEIESLGPPAYYPQYMINHGLHASMLHVTGDSPPDPIVNPFDPEKLWKEALNGYLKCNETEFVSRTVSAETKNASGDTVTGIQIPGTYERITVTKETYAKEINQCVPLYRHDSSSNIVDFPSPNLIAYEHSAANSIFVLHKTTGVCLKLSQAGYPILATETFHNTVVPIGVPQDIMETWRRQIARLIAMKGSARVTYPFANGNAFFVDYRVQKGEYQLQYSMSLKKAGSWESEKRDMQLTHPLLTSIEQTKRHGKTMKPFPIEPK